MDRKRMRSRNSADASPSNNSKSRRIEPAVEHVLSRFTWNNATKRKPTKKPNSTKKKTNNIQESKKTKATTRTTPVGMDASTSDKGSYSPSSETIVDDIVDSQPEGKRNHQYNDTWNNLIPPEVLVRIFQMAIDDEGPMPLLRKLGFVCKKWQAVSWTPVLWRHLDMSKYSSLTLKPKMVTSNTFRRRLRHVQKITIDNRNDISNKFILDVCEASGRTLTSIKLAQCNKLTDAALGHVLEHCDTIKSLSLTQCSNMGIRTVNLLSLLKKKGVDIETFVLANMQILKNVSTIFHTLMANCPNLTYLDMSNIYCMGASLNVELLQNRCPKLRILFLGNTRFAPTHATRDQMASAPGFPHLEQLSLAYHTDKYYVCNHFIQRILVRSPNLKLLDLRGCKPVTADVFDLLQLPKLQSLFISRSTITTDYGLIKIANKWKRTVRELDIAWGNLTSSMIDEAFRNLLSENYQSNLSSLNCSGTSIGNKTLRFLLDNAQLTSLDLTSCKGLARGVKRYHDKNSIDLLRMSKKLT